jgi:hypothetical protein
MHLEHFNQERFMREGQLFAWPSTRTLTKEGGMARNTILAATNGLETAGYLEVTRRYNRERRKHERNEYRARIPSQKSAEVDKQLNHPGSDGYTRVVQTGEPYSLNDSLNDSMIQIDSLSASVADATRGTDAKKAKGLPTNGASSKQRAPHRQRARFDASDLAHIYDMFAEGDYDIFAESEFTTIQKIVAICREPGTHEWPLDGAQIAAMVAAGFLRRDGDKIWVDEECLAKAKAWEKQTAA